MFKASAYSVRVTARVYTLASQYGTLPTQIINSNLAATREIPTSVDRLKAGQARQNLFKASAYSVRVAARGYTLASQYGTLSRSTQIISRDIPASADRLKAGQAGQNLSERYVRLEKSLRVKENLANKLSVGSDDKMTGGNITTAKALKNTFRGLVIPEEPKAPEADECCMSGCAICIYDLYEDTRTAYFETLDSIRASLTATGVPADQWPQHLQLPAKHNDDGEKVSSVRSVSLDAFEQLEKTLREKAGR